MIPILSGNVASALGGAYEVANSCRFNDGDSASMSKSSSSGDRRQFTISAWVKRGVLGTEQQIYGFRQNASNVSGLFFDGSTDRLKYSDYQSSTNASIVTNRVFRDPSAWYHIVCAVDTDQGTDTNRIKIYVNGTQETSFAETTYPSQNTDLYVNVSGQNHYIGTEQSGRYFDGYMAEVVFIDGTQYAASDFGEFDSDSPTIWKPKDVSGLTFGTNGFYLDFEDSSNLGNDANGGTDFTESNLAATDQATDTPTNNFCTMNPLANYFPASTFSEGNCKIVTGSSAYTYNIGTFGLTSGKWYWEVKYTAADGDPHNVGHFGISGKGDPTANSHPLGYYSTDYGIHAESGGTITNNNSGTTNSDYDLDIGDILGFGLDLDSGTKTLKFLVNGTDKIDTNISSSPESGAYFPAFGFTYSAGTGTFEANFGGCSAFTVSSGNSDANGYGNFEYAVPSGYLALCTKNLGSDGG